MPDWQLDPVTPQDLDTILTIDRAAFKRPWQRKSFVAELVHKDAFGYVVRKKVNQKSSDVIAYVFVRVILNEMHIMRIAVAASFQTKGVATRMLRQCFTLAQQKQLDAVYIEVRPGNTSATALYRKAGFQSLGTRPNYYPETGEDALVMVKHLKVTP